MRGHVGSVVRQFSTTDRRRLERALSVAREARLYRRVKAVLLVAEGRPINDAARRVRATRLSVRRWIERYLATRDAAALAGGPTAPWTTALGPAAHPAPPNGSPGTRSVKWTPILGPGA